MPRPRRPPGAGLALTTLLALVILGPSLLAAAQQQQPPLDPLLAHTILQHHGKSSRHEAAASAKRRPSTALLAQNERAVATKLSSAPAITAVRAPHAINAATGALAPTARSLHDWEVEDFVLLATVDGRIHARDRYTGEEIWELAGKPMLETIYNASEGSASLRDQPFVWIVEPKEDGALYFLAPGPYPVLQKIGLTVKQLANIAPYSSEDPALPVVYNVEKKTFMLVVEAASGKVKKSFSPTGSYVVDSESCAPQGKDYFGAHERECSGTINLGQTQYTISIHNKMTNDHVCTIKYAEWAPNNRDKDLQLQYQATMDNQYIYSLYNGEVVALDHNRPKWSQRPLFRQELPYPVARVFDVARPTNDDTPEPALILLPQPIGPAGSEEKAKHVWLNTTDTGAWFALSEEYYPVVTDGAPPASCYMPDTIVSWDGPHTLPDEKSLVGVHVLDSRLETRSRYQAIAAPTPYHNEDGHAVIVAPTTSPSERPTIDAPPETIMESRTASLWLTVTFLCILVATSVVSYKHPPSQFETAMSYFSQWAKLGKTKEQPTPTPAASEQKKEPAEEQKIEKLAVAPVLEAAFEGVPEAVAVAAPAAAPVEESTVSAPTTPEPAISETREKKVTFAIPEDEEPELESLSRSTTIDQSSPLEDDSDEMATPGPNGDSATSGNTQGTNMNPDGTPQEPNAAPATPTKKKKTHRGKRGGRKLNKNQQKEDDEVDRIVDAAKQLDPTPRLHPDEVTMNGDDMQDVSNIKRIGKLTIDQDRLLGNGSGGTFVFEGKWNVSDVYIPLTRPGF
jgi:serine/threonine-protein kinase/endoribonuclease IRE1